MRRLKWVPLTIALGMMIILNPTHSPAQFGGKGFGKGGGFGGTQPGGGGFGGAQPGGGGFGGFSRKSGSGGGDPSAIPGGAPSGVGGGAPTVVMAPGSFGDPSAAIVVAPGSGFGGTQPGGGGFGGMQPGGFGSGGAGGFGGGRGGFGGFGGGMQPGGFGGAPSGGGPTGGSRGGMDPERIWSMLQQQTGEKGDSIDLSKLSPQIRALGKMLAERTGSEPLPESGVMTKAAFLEFSARNAAKIAASTGGGGSMAMSLGGDPNGRGMRMNFDPNGGGFNFGGGGFGGGGFGGFGGGNGDFGGNRQTERREEEPKPVAMRYGHLPEGLPDWFESRDLDKDGQVAMHEWRKAGAELAEFAEFDLNSDGLITADELVRGGVSNRSAGGRRGGQGTSAREASFALPGSTPPTSDKPSATNDKGDRSSKGGSDRGSSDAGGGFNPFRKGDFGGKKGKN